MSGLRIHPLDIFVWSGQGNFIDIQQQVYAGEHRHLAIEQLNYQTGIKIKMKLHLRVALRYVNLVLFALAFKTFGLFLL